VAGKVHFTKNADELADFIPRNRIPKEVGGDEDWEFTYPEPVPDENKLMEDTATRDALQKDRTEMVHEYEDATVAWITLAGADEADELTKQKERRAKTAEQLRANYWKLDPYVRARSYLDRQGILSSGGALNFYPEQGASKTSEAAANPTADDDVD
jgi:hypothetical protein